MKMVEQRDDAEVRGWVLLIGQMELGYPWLPLTQLSDCIWMTFNLMILLEYSLYGFLYIQVPMEGSLGK